jgi:hypothetical protein
MIALRRRFNRKGQSLILVFLLLIALTGVLALTFDYGFVLLARRQMQTGVNAAALEGLRGKGHQGVSFSDEERRLKAQTLLQLNFDDDFDLDTNHTTIGGGIDSSLIQRDGNTPDHLELGDSNRPTTGAYTIGEKDTPLDQDLANRSEFIYRPDTFQLNIGNDGDNDGEVNPEGDMVAGDYNESDTEHREGPKDLAIEPPSYTRGDFTPATIVNTLSGNYDSFLVRMRRTHNPHDLDEIPGVSSRGGGLPLILARAGWLPARRHPITGQSFRRDGVVVRATAIAAEQPIVSVFVSSNLSVYQLLPYSILIDEANETWQDTPLTELYTDDPIDPNAPPADLLPLRCGIGTEVTAGAPIAMPTNLEGYVAVVSEVNGVQRIIGFRLFGSTEARHRNDSPRLQDAWPSLPTDPAVRQEVIDANRNNTFNLDSSPALMRAVR